MFPHTHVKEHHHNGHHHHHHDEHSDENGLSVLFSHFSHFSDTFSNSHLEDAVKIVKEVPNQQIIVCDNHLNYSNPIGFYNKKELVRNREPLIFISPHLYSFQFRGPPSSIS
jgi:two-component SAPR family response regulator